MANIVTLRVRNKARGDLKAAAQEKTNVKAFRYDWTDIKRFECLVRTHRSFHKIAALPVSESISTYGNHSATIVGLIVGTSPGAFMLKKIRWVSNHPVRARRLVGSL
jgi:hypothetical protein